MNVLRKKKVLEGLTSAQEKKLCEKKNSGELKE